jgi:hypothetical protein
MRRHLRRVGDHDDGVALPREVLEQRQDLGAARAVEGSGGLVGEDDLAAVHERPRNGDALLLAARELIRPVLEPLRQPQHREQRARPLAPLARRRARVDGGHLDVLGGARGGDEVVALEDEPERLAAQPRQLVAPQA